MEKTISIWSKKVKEKEFKYYNITENQEEFLKVIKSLLQWSKEQRKLDELKLEENCREWVTTILEKYPHQEESLVRYLLNDFTDSLMTRMREEDKYAIAILFENSLLICHSNIGEMTITPSFEIIERMLDKDNVSRYVYFYKTDAGIMVSFWEYYASHSLTEWLGLSEKESSYYLKGKIRIHTEILGTSLIMELNEEDTEKLLENIKYEQGVIHLPEKIEALPVKEVRMGNIPYKDFTEFQEDFLAKRKDLNYYITRYNKIYQDLFFPPSVYQYYDEEDKVVRIVGDKKETVVRKNTQDFIILFADKNIKIREQFINKIFAKFLNKEQLSIFHAGDKFSHSPIKVGTMAIFNKLNISIISSEILKYYESTKIIDNSFFYIINYVIFSILSEENRNFQISFFLNEFSYKLLNKIELPYKISQLEDKIFEFKSREFLRDGDKKIAERLTDDLLKKLKTSNIKIYLIGINGSTGEIEPISSGQFGDDRIQSIKQQIEKNIEEKTGTTINLSFVKIPCKNGRLILLMTAYVDMTNTKKEGLKLESF